MKPAGEFRHLFDLLRKQRGSGNPYEGEAPLFSPVCRLHLAIQQAAGKEQDQAGGNAEGADYQLVGRRTARVVAVGDRLRGSVGMLDVLTARPDPRDGYIYITARLIHHGGANED